MAFMKKEEILYAIATGDLDKEKKMEMIKSEVNRIRSSERIRIANALLNNDSFGGLDE